MMAEAERDQTQQWDLRIGTRSRRLCDEWGAQYYSHYGANDRHAYRDAVEALKSNGDAVYAYRLVWDGQLISKPDAIETMTAALKQNKPSTKVYQDATALSKTFDCKGTLWRSKTGDNVGGGMTILLDRELRGTTRVDIAMKVKTKDGADQDAVVSFELTRDVFGAASEVTELGYLTDGFYHKQMHWIKRNEVLAAMINEHAEGLLVGVSFSGSKLQVRASGPLANIVKLSETLAKGWQIQWGGKERELRIGTSADCDAAAANRQAFVKQRNQDEDTANGDRKLTILGLVPEAATEDITGNEVRKACQTFCEKGSIDDFGLKTDKNGNSF